MFLSHTVYFLCFNFLLYNFLLCFYDVCLSHLSKVYLFTYQWCPWPSSLVVFKDKTAVLGPVLDLEISVFVNIAVTYLDFIRILSPKRVESWEKRVFSCDKFLTGQTNEICSCLGVYIVCLKKVLTFKLPVICSHLNIFKIFGMLKSVWNLLHNPPHIRHVATLPWEIKMQIFCNMPKVRWVISCEFCSKFHTLSSTAKFQLSVKIWQSYREFKGGKFCRDTMYTETWIVTYVRLYRLVPCWCEMSKYFGKYRNIQCNSALLLEAGLI